VASTRKEWLVKLEDAFWAYSVSFEMVEKPRRGGGLN